MTMKSNSLVPFSAILSDPRGMLDDRALALASQNAYPIVASRTVRKDHFGLAMGGGIALLLGGLTFWTMSGTRDVPAPKVSVASPVAVQGSTPTSIAVPLDAITPATVPQGQANALAGIPNTPVLSAPPQMQPLVNRAAAPVMVLDTSTGFGPATSGAPLGTGSPAAPAIQGLSDNEAFASRVGNSGVDTAHAAYLINPAHTVTQGTMIPAVLETAVDSDLPGFVRAVVSQDVLSFDGKRILIPRSSRLIGQYKSGLSAGQTRIFVLWSRLIRPDGASVAIASPATDFEGRSGLPGDVNSHFMKRFGSAMLLSVIGAAGAIGNAGLLITGSQSAASVAAQRDSQIPPTVRVRPGQPIRIFTARDLDFSTIQTAVAAP
jgi:type IV secretion system protein VirB10